MTPIDKAMGDLEKLLGKGLAPADKPKVWKILEILAENWDLRMQRIRKIGTLGNPGWAVEIDD